MQLFFKGKGRNWAHEKIYKNDVRIVFLTATATCQCGWAFNNIICILKAVVNGKVVLVFSDAV